MVINKQQTGMSCDYCGKKRERVMFCIGASKKPEWTMHEGTGKVSCPDCWEKGTAEGVTAVEKHCGIKR